MANISDLMLRFLTLREVEGPDPDELTQILSTAAQHRDGVWPRDYSIPALDFAEIKDIRKVPNWTPWMDQYRVSFLKMLGVSELEFFSHPIAG